ncbi:MAG: tripartite tricarboxylate transporter substrate binding protein [Burkholderiaceae bacterium]|nr:tripartite tricarboxylate transporter substrate binding protein [Burkholderiaceae bacterium]
MFLVSKRLIGKTVIAGALMAALGTGTALAQSYPNKTITLVAPYAVGGDSDFSGRNLSVVASKLIGQSVIVTNIVGASGTIGSQRVRTAAPDGYTLLVSRGGSQAITPALDSSTPYKWNDFTFISLLDFNPVVCVVKPDAPYKTMKDLIEAIRTNPGKLNYATAGPGTTQHLAVEVILSQIGLPSTAAMMIPYKGGGEATTALLGGQVQFICNNLTTMVGQIKGGAMRALVTSTPSRLKDFPDVPTAREMGVSNLEQVMGWSGLYGPPGLPAEVVTKWQAVLRDVAKDPNWSRGNDTVGAIPAIRSPQDTEKFAKEQFDLYSKLGAQLNLKK